MIFDFENPLAFIFLILIPVLYICRAFKIFIPISFPIILSDWNGPVFEWKKKTHSVFSVIIHMLCIIGYVCVIVAFADPVVHHQERVYSSRGSDILFVLDVSPSMSASDIGGKSRIKAAQQAIYTLAKENNGNSLGLVEMAKDAAVVVPPTIDRDVFFDKLSKITVGELGDGTALGIGLSCAVLHLESSSAPRKSIILITDGENNAGAIHPYTAARMAKNSGISLYVLGIGTSGAVPLDYVDPKTGKVYSGFLESNYDTSALQKVALEGGGKFFEISSMSALSQVLSTINKTETVVQGYQLKNKDTTYYYLFVFAGILFFILAWILKRVIMQEIL